MNFTEPQPLTKIIDAFDAKTPLGSVMRTKDWERMPAHIRDQAFFSAGVTNAQFLAAQQNAIGAMIKRARETNERGEPMWKMDRSRFIAELRQMGEAAGIPHPDGPRQGGIRERDLTDPISIARLKLVVNTQLEMAYGAGQYTTAMSEDILSEWPAWELVRISPRKQPRDWAQRWAEAGGTLHDGRMIALKTSPVWAKLSRFGKPHPPFDFNSGMGVEEIDRDTAEALGLLDAATVLQPDLKAAQEPLEASLAGVPPELRKKLKAATKGKVQIKGDKATARFKQADMYNPQRGMNVDVDPQVKTRIEQVAALEDDGQGFAFGARNELQDATPEGRKAIAKFEREMLGKARERARVYDPTCTEIRDQAVGAAAEVTLDAAALPGAVMTHLHPRDMPPSTQDLFQLLKHGMQELRACTRQGVYSLRPAAGTGMKAAAQAMAQINSLAAQAQAVVARQGAALGWSPERMERAVQHAVLAMLADRGIIHFSLTPHAPR